MPWEPLGDKIIGSARNLFPVYNITYFFKSYVSRFLFSILYFFFLLVDVSFHLFMSEHQDCLQVKTKFPEQWRYMYIISCDFTFYQHFWYSHTHRFFSHFFWVNFGSAMKNILVLIFFVCFVCLWTLNCIILVLTKSNFP